MRKEILQDYIFQGDRADLCNRDRTLFRLLVLIEAVSRMAPEEEPGGRLLGLLAETKAEAVREGEV